MLVNRKELARRVAINGGYSMADMEKVLKELEDVIVEAVEKGDLVKLGKVFRLGLQEVAKKECWDNFNKRYVTREAKLVPKFDMLKRLEDIEIPLKGDDDVVVQKEEA